MSDAGDSWVAEGRRDEQRGREAQGEGATRAAQHVRFDVSFMFLHQLCTRIPAAGVAGTPLPEKGNSGTEAVEAPSSSSTQG